MGRTRRPTRMRIRPNRLAIVAATVAVSMVGCVAKPEPVPSLPPGRPAETKIPAASAPAAGQWELRRLGDQGGPEEFDAIAATPAAFVVAGLSGSAAERPVALSSGDGLAWSAERIPSRGMQPVRLVAWGDRLLAVGEGSSNRCAHPGGEFDTWVRSGDGRWAEAPFAAIFCAGTGSAASVALFDGRPWLALDGVADVPFLADSDDGLHWRDRSDLAGDIVIGSLLADADGLWLFGRARDGSPVVRHSGDGRTWTATSLAGLGDVFATFVIEGRVRGLASDGTRTMLLERGPGDGWQATPIVGLPQETLLRVVAIGDRVVAVGSRDDGIADLWASRDGSTWGLVDLPGGLVPGSSLVDVAVRGEAAVLVGQVPAPDGSVVVGAIWEGPASLLGG